MLISVSDYQNASHIKRDSLKSQKAVSSVLKPGKSEDIPKDDGIGIEVDPLSALLVLLVFLADRIIGFFTSRSLNRQNWYIDIIIKPNLSRVDQYYEDLQNQLVTSIGKLKPMTSKSSLQTIHKAIANEVQLHNHIAEQFEYDFIYLVRSHDVKKSNLLLGKLIEAKDFVATTLDANKLPGTKVEDIKSKIKLMKADFYQTMFSS